MGKREERVSESVRVRPRAVDLDRHVAWQGGEAKWKQSVRLGQKEWGRVWEE
jgi:hypothetical protein